MPRSGRRESNEAWCASPTSPGLRSATRHAAGTTPDRCSPVHRVSAMPVEYLTPAIEDRALQVQMLLASKGQHRASSIPDLIIAAAAELAGLTVLHLDKDFDLIAGITGQPTERLLG